MAFMASVIGITGAGLGGSLTALFAGKFILAANCNG